MFGPFFLLLSVLALFQPGSPVHIVHSSGGSTSKTVYINHCKVTYSADADLGNPYGEYKIQNSHHIMNDLVWFVKCDGHEDAVSGGSTCLLSDSAEAVKETIQKKGNAGRCFVIKEDERTGEAL